MIFTNINSLPKNAVFLRLRNEPEYYFHFITEGERKGAYTLKKGVYGACVFKKKVAVRFMRQIKKRNIESIPVVDVVGNDGSAN